MLNANASDVSKLEAVVRKVLTDALDTHARITVEDDYKGSAILRFVRVRHADLYDACKFSRLRKVKLTDEVNDVLSGAKLCADLGVWFFVEYEIGDAVFIYIAENTKQSTLDVLRNRGELVEVQVADLNVFSAEPAGWYVTGTGLIKQYNPNNKAHSVEGNMITVKYSYGSYTTTLHATKSAARTAKLAAVVEDEDDSDE